MLARFNVSRVPLTTSIRCDSRPRGRRVLRVVDQNPCVVSLVPIMRDHAVSLVVGDTHTHTHTLHAVVGGLKLKLHLIIKCWLVMMVT